MPRVCVSLVRARLQPCRKAWDMNYSSLRLQPPFGKLRAAHSTLLRAVSETRTVSGVEPRRDGQTSGAKASFFQAILGMAEAMP